MRHELILLYPLMGWFKTWGLAGIRKLFVKLNFPLNMYYSTIQTQKQENEQTQIKVIGSKICSDSDEWCLKDQ